MSSQTHCLPSSSPQQTRQRSSSISSQLSLKLRVSEADVAPDHSINATPFADWPKTVSGGLVWSGTDLASVAPHVVELLPADIAEIESAVDSFKDPAKIDLDNEADCHPNQGRDLHGDKVNGETFPLSEDLRARLGAGSDAVHNKQGYCMVKGLEPVKYSAEDNALIYLGIASHIGNVRGVQDTNGNMLSHITVAKQWEAVPDKLRHGVHTNKSMPFHNDMGADILGLHYRQTAKEGGVTHLSSAWTLYNELSKKHPEVLETLATPNWPIQITKRRTRHYLAPLVQFHEGKLMVSLDPGRLGRQQANAEHVPTRFSSTMASSSTSRVPTLSHMQLTALETFNRLALEHKISVAAQPGDMLFINNWALVHARDAYTDDGSQQQRRHAVRIWLHNEKLGWSRPAGMTAPWMAAFGYHFKQGGDPAAADPRNVINRKYPIVPAVDYRIPKYTAGSAAFVLDSSDDEDYLDDSDFE